ncbi:pyridoxamine 5'-phosphate oxidase family protein [Nonomuraea ferruginea]|uniref:Pyridoxamine 5'-phosphate oxidase family protein n=1 Tax=Nonomuraea ferruginea TaxID=46174 RepID=A0ABT4T7L0_9ACTN|nr:pyridoxamine 5'-phosphate oxidase family protein [Nonomuraea ferruginea]MDA0645504.1 pyridoxamine 5'-phosphate oxidase family protein [Nonomuraea ferruginea]
MKPITELDARFSAGGAAATTWEEAAELLERAEVWWLSTVRRDGRPHVTPLLAVWQDGALHFCTGPEEQKARNLEANRQVALTTGANTLRQGLDLVVEGVAEQVTDEGRLKALAEAWEAKYGPDWHFDVHDGAFHNSAGGRALVFEVAPARAFGFRKGDYAQTRWRF